MTSVFLRESPSLTRVAVIGTGHWGPQLVRTFCDLGVLAAICDICPERRDAMAVQYPHCTVTDAVETFFYDPQIDAVAIATPAESHGRLVRQAILAGKDVFVEKPLCLSFGEGRSLVDLAQQHRRILMVGHLLRYHPAVVKLIEIIDGGDLGNIQYVYSNRLNFGRIRRAENTLWSFAPHDISVILRLLNEIPQQVHCEGGNYLHEKISDVTISHLTFPSGIKGHIFVSWLHPFKEQKLVVVGDRQMAVFDDMENEGKLKLFPHTVTLQKQVSIANKAEAETVPIEVTEPLRNECEHFLECIQTRKTPLTDGEEGLRVLKVLQRCQRSLEHNSVLDEEHLLRSGESPVDCFIHDSAFIDDNVTIGAGTRIWHVSHIMTGSRLGENCRIGQNVVVGPRASIGAGVKIQNNVSVYEGVTLEDHVFCGPSVVFTNVLNPRSEIRRMDERRPTLVKQGATLGANCTILCGTTIGHYAFVGAGAVVTDNVPDYALVYGLPARIQGWVCQCGKQLDLSSDEIRCECGRRYEWSRERIELKE